MSDASSPRSPFGAHALDGAVGVFAAFTVLTHATVWWGGGLDALLAASGATAAVAVGVAVFTRGRRRGDPKPTARALEGPAVQADASEPSARLRGAIWTGGLVSVAAGYWTGGLNAWWLCAAATVLLALVAQRSTPVVAPPPIRTPASDRTLIGLGLLLAAVVSIAHRSDADDAFYVNLIASAIDRPDVALLSGDTMHGYANVPMSLPVFYLMSWEIFQAAIGRLVGASGLTIAHVIVPPLVALLVPLAWGRLAVRLVPRSWPFLVVGVVVGLLAVGDGRAGFGDFGVLRLHQGKSVLLHVALPLCAAYGIEFGLAPSVRAFLRLAAVQIAAVGLSSTGLWLAPTVAGIGLLTPFSFEHLEPAALARRARVLGIGLAASLYPVALALALRPASVRAIAEAVRPLEGASLDAASLIAFSTAIALGNGAFLWIALLSIVTATAAFGAPLLRRFAAVGGAVLLLVFFDPFTAHFVAHQVTGTDTYFRVLWLVPIPLYVAALVCTPFDAPLPARLARPAVRAGLAIVVGVGVFGIAPEVPTLSATNDVRFGWPGPKLPPHELADARIIADHAGPEAFVLAPIPIARWIPLIQRPPRPLMTRALYLDRLHDRLGGEELDRRRALTRLVGGAVRLPDGPAILARAIDEYPLEVVCLTGPALGWPELRSVLLDSPLEVVDRDADHEIWARPSHAGS